MFAAVWLLSRGGLPGRLFLDELLFDKLPPLCSRRRLLPVLRGGLPGGGRHRGCVGLNLGLGVPPPPPPPPTTTTRRRRFRSYSTDIPVLAVDGGAGGSAAYSWRLRLKDLGVVLDLLEDGPAVRVTEVQGRGPPTFYFHLF